MSTVKRVLRHEIPVDDDWHIINGRVLSLACRRHDSVDVWTLDGPLSAPDIGAFGVFGTGQTVPFGADYVGTAVTPDQRLVWHVFRASIGPDGKPEIGNSP